MVHTVIFDIGGTLTGAPDLFEELSELFDTREKKKIYKMIMEEFASIYRFKEEPLDNFLLVEEIISKTLKTVSSKLKVEDKAKYAIERYKKVYIENAFIYDDTIRVLDFLHRNGVNLIVASDADSEVLFQQLKKLNIKRYFSSFFVSSDLKGYKPSDRFISPIREILNEPLDKILFVGDSEVDILSGKYLGVQTVLKGKSKLIKTKPDYIIHNLIELIEICREL